MDDLLDPILVFPNNTVILHTLGPKNPPTPFVPLAFLDTLIAMKNEAKLLEWIKGDLSSMIDERLGRARNILIGVEEGDAKAELQAALDAVVAECAQVGPTSDLTPEGCTLLQYNLEYLIKQLVE